MFPVTEAKLICSTTDCSLNGDECTGNGGLTATDSVMDGSNNSPSLAASSMHRKHTVITKVSAIKDRLTVSPDGEGGATAIII